MGETSVFWWNGAPVYTIASKAAVSTDAGEEIVVPGFDIPTEFVENAKRIGRQVLEVLPQLRTPGGQPVGMTLIRTDVGCSEGPIHDRGTHWDPKVKTFFLNEIEYGGTNYFARHQQFDIIPLWAEKYATKSREVHAEMVRGKKLQGNPNRKRARTEAVACKGSVVAATADALGLEGPVAAKAVLKKPAARAGR